MNQLLSRRDFVSRSLAGAAACAAVSYGRILGANERIGLGFIGYGLIGKQHVADFGREPGADRVALAEVYRPRLAEGLSAMGGQAAGYADFRRLLDDRRVDAVVISTPDHWHALMTMLACDAGKDVYVEKPLTLFQREGSWMLDVAARTRRVVQVGTQQRSGPHYQRARELMQRGALGEIVSVRMQSARNIGAGFGKPADGPQPPDLDWELWQGPAPSRPYNPLRAMYHFRWFWDYSGGQMTNLGAHHLDIVDWVLGLEPLRGVCSVGGRLVLKDGGETPDTQDALFDCGKFIATWSHRECSRGPVPAYGLEFFGTHGSLGISRSGFKLTPDAVVPPENLIPGIGEHPAGGPQPVAAPRPLQLRGRPVEDTTGESQEQFQRHARNFLDSIRARRQPVSDLASAHRTATACHLANLSLRLSRHLRWDAAKQTIPGDPQAAALLVREYRSPWDKELQALKVQG
jgi:predicted dehydrogenase